MAITAKQFDQLSEMGISLWQSRITAHTDDDQQQNYLAQNPENLANLSQKKLFNDILLSLNLTIGEVKPQGDHLDVGLFNWYFIDKDFDEEFQHEQLTINCSNNKLISPSIETITQSTLLKKQLWHTIANNLL